MRNIFLPCGYDVTRPHAKPPEKAILYTTFGTGREKLSLVTV